MAADEETPAGGLTGLDWFVITAAAVSLILAATWLVKGLPKPATRPAE